MALYEVPPRPFPDSPVCPLPPCPAAWAGDTRPGGGGRAPGRAPGWGGGTALAKKSSPFTRAGLGASAESAAFGCACVAPGWILLCLQPCNRDCWRWLGVSPVLGRRDGTI